MKIGTTGLALAGAALFGGRAIAQTVPQDGATASPGNAPVVTMPPPVITVPLPPAVPPTPDPVAVPTPRATATPPVPRETEPRPIVRPTPQATATPRARPTPAATPAPPPEPAPSPAASLGTAPIASPTPTPVPIPASLTAEPIAWRTWLIPAAVGAVIVLVLGLLLLLWRRRHIVDNAPVLELPPPPRFVPPPAPPGPAPSAEPVAETPPSPPPPVAAPQFLERPVPSERAWLDLAAPTVHRAGVNLVTATADVSLTVRNEGSAAARDIRVAILLTSAQPGQDAALDALYAQPVARPVVPPFTLAPGEEKVVRGLATMPREGIVALSAADRPMFVPVVALNALYDAAGGTPGQTTAAFAAGVERGDGAKLAPIWLDEPARMHDAIAIRAHGTTVKR